MAYIIIIIIIIYKIASNTLLSKLDAVYHSAIRFITKAPYTTHHCDLYAVSGPHYISVAKPTGSRSSIISAHWSP